MIPFVSVDDDDGTCDIDVVVVACTPFMVIVIRVKFTALTLNRISDPITISKQFASPPPVVSSSTALGSSFSTGGGDGGGLS
jgi:hypothetical protein